ncbi:hypothetical protein [Streptomyces luteireticuli]|uniref:hypothetical protein n=1 Tax=Streptomyces luteireticuli TaxID=173858 RepID=UPI0035564916
MRLRSTAVLALAAVGAFSLTGCSHSTSTTAESASAPAAVAQPKSEPKPATAPLSSAALRDRLLNESDLGQGYARKPDAGEKRHDDVTLVGCPALDKLGGDAATGGSLDFANEAKATFTYNGDTDSEVSEELYSDTTDKLSKGTGQIFNAMTSCPTFQIVTGSTPVDVATQKISAPHLGDEQWSHLLTYTAGGQRSVVKQTVIRSGNTMTILTGAPALVDAHVEKALRKATSR